MCSILSPEMSVDSDRDSVIESEDGKEAVVRHFFLFVTVFFKVLNLAQEIKHFCIYLCNSIQMRTLVRRRRRVTIILRR